VPIRLPALVFSFALFSAAAHAEEWPHWLGPRGDGISTEVAFAKPWPAAGLNKVWSKPIGRGFSSPIALDGRVYAFHDLEGAEHLTAYDANSGAVLWDEKDEGGWNGDHPGTRATPAISEGAIYTYGGAGDLTARNLADGKKLWRLNILKAVGAQPMIWGVGSSPLVIGDLIYVQTAMGGSIAVAVNRKTGDIAWQSEEKGVAGYAPVIQVEIGGQKVLILAAGQQVVAVRPDTGKTLWKAPFHIEEDVHAATPVYRDGALFVTAAYNAGGALLKVTPKSATISWTSKQVTARFNPAILDHGYLYLNSEGFIECVDWFTGDVMWTAEERELRVGQGGAVLRVADKLITLSDRGVLTLLKATPSGYSKVSQFQAGTGWQNFAIPLLYRNRLYLRGETTLTVWAAP
jgi:outer membrane protein assembly factor BamB